MEQHGNSEASLQAIHPCRNQTHWVRYIYVHHSIIIKQWRKNCLTINKLTQLPNIKCTKYKSIHWHFYRKLHLYSTHWKTQLTKDIRTFTSNLWILALQFCRITASTINAQGILERAQKTHCKWPPRWRRRKSHRRQWYFRARGGRGMCLWWSVEGVKAVKGAVKERCGVW